MSLGTTIGEKLVAAALTLEEAGKTTFSAEDLVVMAWRKFPDAFGLAGYVDEQGQPAYPDSNRVYMEIMGSKSLRKQGLVQKVGSKMYRLTDAGRRRARELRTPGAPPQVEPIKLALAREQVEQLLRLFDSKAARKVRGGTLNDVSFFDACGFWGLNARSGAKDLWSRFAHIDALVKAAEEALGPGDKASAKHGGVPLTAEDLSSLRNVHHVLCQRFSSEIDLIKRRTDER